MSPLLGTMVERNLNEAATLDLTGVLVPQREETPRQQVLRLLDEIIAEVGEDYVYPAGKGCYYADVLVDGRRVPGEGYQRYNYNLDKMEWDSSVQEVTGSCVVGRLIEKIDAVSFENLALHANGEGLAGIDGYLPDAWQRDQGLMLALYNAQTWQDAEEPYGRVRQGVVGILTRCPEGATVGDFHGVPIRDALRWAPVSSA